MTRARMAVTSGAPTRGMGLLAFAVLLACEPAAGTAYPTEGDDEARLERLEARRQRAGAEGKAPAGTDAAAEQAAKDEPKPKPRDRDPEEEKRKMAQSRAQSAQARKLLMGGRFPDAIASSRAALKVHEQNVDAMLVLAEVFLRQSKYELTRAVTDSALKVDEKIRSPQETSQIYNLQGFALLGLGHPNLATQAFRKAAETDEKNAAAWNNLGKSYLEAGDVGTAASCFAYALELQPNMPKAHLNQGAALRAQGKWQEAEQAFLRALQYRKNYPEAHFNLGVLYLDADPFPGLDTVGRLNKAILSLERYKGMARTNTNVPRPRAKSGVTSLPPVSVERADDYIRVAQKGLDREQRRLERENKRTVETGTQQPGAGASATAASAEGGGPSSGATQPATATGPAKPQTPGGATSPAAPQTPGGVAKPQTPGGGAASPAAPQAPGGTASPTKPQSPQTPGGGAAKPQTPGGTTVSPQTPGGSPAKPQSPTG